MKESGKKPSTVLSQREKSEADVLDLSALSLTSVPDDLSQLTNLKELNLSNNLLTTIPEMLGQLTNLRLLHLEGNPLPEEIFAVLKSGIPALLRYLVGENKVYSRTVRLVLLGEPGSGKTSLVEAMMGDTKPCNPARYETVGVNVKLLERIHPQDGQPMFISAWDFAGQNIEHATHQLYLTNAAIYLILWNARLGAEASRRDLWYWLELLKMRVENPQFLLVATHTEFTPPDLDLSDIEHSYAGCMGMYPVELQNLKGMPELMARIDELAAASPAMRAQWPKWWFDVRGEIHKLRKKRPYITPQEFRSLMEEKGVTDEAEQNDIANHLHHLGEILYFQQNEELNALIILDLEWVTKMVGIVVRSEEARKNEGILHKVDLEKLWQREKLNVEVERYLIELMNCFDLTYSTGHRQDIVMVVEALPFSTSAILQKFEPPNDSPSMEIIFRFPSPLHHLPPGIPTWSIARAHRYLDTGLKGNPRRDAAVFKDEETLSRAVVIASEATKEVRLKVTGDDPLYFFVTMKSILVDTFKRYGGAQPEPRLPCPCQPKCRNSYKFDVVMQRLNAGEMIVSCDETGANVRIATLLSGVPEQKNKQGRRALQSDEHPENTQRIFRALREQMVHTCPAVFTLVPSRDFVQLDTWIESITQGEELELTLYCEHDSGWHATEYSLYRFTPDQEWFASLKGKWNGFVHATKHVGVIASVIGKASTAPWAKLAGSGIEKISEVSLPAADTLAKELGLKEKPYFVDIETRFILERLINHLDLTQRPINHTKPHNGGLSRALVDDGRVLWLCHSHAKAVLG